MSEFWTTTAPLYAVALASLIVGLGGAFVGWSTSKRAYDSQLRSLEVQRQVAADQRIWQHRADAYTEALALLHEIIRALPSVFDADEGETAEDVEQTPSALPEGLSEKVARFGEQFDDFLRNYDWYPPATLRARITTYGTKAAVETFDSGYRSAHEAAGALHAMHLFLAAEDGELANVKLTEYAERTARAQKQYEHLGELATRDLQRS